MKPYLVIQLLQGLVVLGPPIQLFQLWFFLFIFFLLLYKLIDRKFLQRSLKRTEKRVQREEATTQNTPSPMEPLPQLSGRAHEMQSYLQLQVCALL